MLEELFEIPVGGIIDMSSNDIINPIIFSIDHHHVTSFLAHYIRQRYGTTCLLY